MGDWAVFHKHDKLSAWTGGNVRECYNEVEQEDEDRPGIAQDILQMSTDFLRRIILPVDGQKKRGHLVVCMPSLPPIPD